MVIFHSINSVELGFNSKNLPLVVKWYPKKYINDKKNKRELIKTIDKCVKNEAEILEAVKTMDIAPKLYYAEIAEDLSYIATEFMKGGSLTNFLNQVFSFVKSPSWPDINTISHKLISSNGEFQRSLFKEIYDLVKIIHSNEIYHLDLKPDNIVINSNLKLKLIDFGFGQNLGKFQYSHSGRLFSICGTDGFCAPEVCTLKEEVKKGYIPGPVDVFALGVTLFILNAGFFPFTKTNSTDELYCLIQKGQYELFWNFIDLKLANLKIPIFSDDLKKLIIDRKSVV